MTLGSDKGAIAPSLCEVCGRGKCATLGYAREADPRVRTESWCNHWRLGYERLNALLAECRREFQWGGTVKGRAFADRIDAALRGASRERAEGPPDLKSLLARAEKAERERDETEKVLARIEARTKDAEASLAHWATRANAAESALAEARHKAMWEAAQLVERLPTMPTQDEIAGTVSTIRALASGNAPEMNQEKDPGHECASSHVPRDTACRSFLAGMNGRCVYCDHEAKCHPGPGATCEIGSGERPAGPPEKRVIWYPADGSPGPSDTKPALASEQPTAGAPEKSDQATPARSLEEK